MIRLIQATPSEPRLPPAAAMARNAARALMRNTAAAISGDALRVSQETKAERLEICRACPKFRPSDGRCSLCGCWTAVKLSLAAESCPDTPARWSAEPARRPGDPTA